MNKRQIFTTVLSVLVSVFLVAGVVMATTTIGTNITNNSAVATGIGLTGTYSKGIDLSNATLTQGLGNGLICIGTQAAPKTIAMTTSTIPLVVNLNNTGNAATGMIASYFKVATGANQPLAQLVAVAPRVTVNENLDSAYGVQSHMTVSGAKTSSELIAVSAYTLLGTGARTADRVCALQAMFDGSGTAGTVVGDAIVGYFVNGGTVITTNDIVKVYNQNAATTVDMVHIENTGTATTGINLIGAVTNGIDMSGATIGTADIVLSNSATITNSKAGQVDIAGLEAATAAGSDGFSVITTQANATALTGTLRGVYIQAINGTTAATGTIEGINVKAKASLTSGSVAVLTGASLDADAKGQSVAIMRAAELILDGSKVGGINEAVGLRIANNLQGAAVATTLYGIQIYADSQAYTADIQLSGGANVTKKPMIMSGSGIPAAGRCTVNNLGSIYLRTDAANDDAVYICEGNGDWDAIKTVTD